MIFIIIFPPWVSQNKIWVKLVPIDHVGLQADIALFKK